MQRITIVDTHPHQGYQAFNGETFETMGHAKARLEELIDPEFQADFRIVSEPVNMSARNTHPAKPPLVAGCFDYFPNALAAIAAHAEYGNAKHNPGEPLHWAFGKSTHHAESVARHLFARGTIDPETGKSHTIALCMRSLMLLETELIAAGATPGRGVK